MFPVLPVGLVVAEGASIFRPEVPKVVPWLAAEEFGIDAALPGESAVQGKENAHYVAVAPPYGLQADLAESSSICGASLVGHQVGHQVPPSVAGPGVDSLPREES